MSGLYYIGWTSRTTGFKGHGVAKFSLSVEQQIANDSNKGKAGKLCHHYPVAADVGEQADAQQVPRKDSL